MSRLVYFAVLLVFVGCVSEQAGKTYRWRDADFVGKTFSLNHATRIQDIRFLSHSHMAVVTFGTRHGKYLELSDPVFRWRRKGEKLEIYNPDSDVIYASFIFLSRDEDTVTVINRQGERVAYNIK